MSEYIERRIPTRPWRNLAIIIAFLLVTVGAIYLAYVFEITMLAGIPFLCAAPIGYYFFVPKRCPECGQKLACYSDFFENSTEFRNMGSCQRCRINWDYGTCGDTKYDGLS